MVATAVAMAVAAHMFGGHNFHHTWHAAHRFLFRRRRTWLPHGSEGTALLAGLIVAALAAPQRRWRQRPTPRIRRRPAAAPLQYLAPPQTPAERREAEVQEAFSYLRQLIQEGDAALAAIKLETWGQGGRPSRALRRAELQILLVEAARTRKPEPALLREMGKELSKLGVPLDWSLEHDCSENFGRYALDAALEAAVKEARSERAALTLLSMGQGSGSGDTSQLDVNPLFRASAGQGMTELLVRLVKECGADVNSKDPLFGATALDRAADAGKERAALRLLELGADPGTGRGVDYLLARLSPKVRAQLPKASTTPRIAPKGELDEDEFGAVRDALRVSEASAMAKIRGRRLSAVQLSQLMDDSARSGFRRKLLRLCIDGLTEAGVAVGWDEDAPHSDASFAGAPLDAALRTAVEVCECLDFDPVAASSQPLRRSVPEPVGAKAPKAPRNTLPPPEPWMGRLLPDAAEPGAPAITGAFFGSFGAFLGVLRGAAVALLTDRFPDLPRSRAFAIGFAASAPWYVSLLGISGVLSVYSARAERAGRPSQLDLSESHPACDLG
ncbi:unnamed protein product [Symbiodinium sp. CCMP2592]|nr:unnamed protein product [Symbiodinium sp. CCMP2592]